MGGPFPFKSSDALPTPTPPDGSKPPVSQIQKTGLGPAVSPGFRSPLARLNGDVIGYWASDISRRKN
jgi:hypothetical protein